MRRPRSHERSAAFGCRTAMSQICGNGTTDIDRQRQSFAPVTLPAHEDLSVAPIDVFQLHGREAPGSESQADEHRQDCEVAPADSCAAVTTGQQLPDLTALNPFWQAAKREPATDGTAETSD